MTKKAVGVRSESDGDKSTGNAYYDDRRKIRLKHSEVIDSKRPQDRKDRGIEKQQGNERFFILLRASFMGPYLTGFIIKIHRFSVKNGWCIEL